MQHFDKKHHAKFKEVRTRKLASYDHARITNLLYFLRMVTAFEWFCYVIHCLWQFSVVKNDNACAQIRYDLMSLSTFDNYLTALTTRVEHSISLGLPDRFSLVFHGQTTLWIHYVTLLATFPSENTTEYQFMFSDVAIEIWHDAQRRYTRGLFTVCLIGLWWDCF